MKIVQINVVANLSTGNISTDIGNLIVNSNGTSYIFFGRGSSFDNGNIYERIGGRTNYLWHGLLSRFTDSQGLHSRGATKHVIKRLKEIQPDIVHLHNIHGYYLNYPVLFDYLKRSGVRVVWTLHDCWPFTGHCAYYTAANCMKWQSHCGTCPEKESYPASIWLDKSKRNLNLKRECFTGLKDMTIVPVSNWLAEDVKKSFLGEYPIITIHNGVDLDMFRPHNNKEDKLILGVASTWDRRKGLSDFLKLRRLLPSDYKIFLVGLSGKQLSALPDGINVIARTDSREALSKLYSRATVFVNPTFEDNFPMVNIEALACGTPVVTYRTGGSPEAVDELTGVVVERGDVRGLVDGIYRAEKLCPEDCRARAVDKFDKNKCYDKYLELYNSLR